ncbi:MAG: phosphoglycerate kinase [Candidatus Aenigmarchaeota archaeon]|nr:phosphoglycerate kinase [Candidatus Aenigmarchaeota archaeon]
MEIASVADLQEVRGKNALVRVSFDAFDKDGTIKDSLRLEASEGTIRTLKEKGARRIILLSYAGRPDGFDPSLSLRPVADFLFGLFKEKVHFVPAKPGMSAAAYVQSVREYLNAKMEDGDVVLLENLRFWKEENEGSDAFARDVASLGGIYVQDGFAQAHRIKNATVGGITKYVKVKVAGIQFAKEVSYLSSIYRNLTKKERGHYIFIIAGKKVETKPGIVSKITVASRLMDSMREGDKVLIGGAVAYPFIAARACNGAASISEIRDVIGDSFVEEEQIAEHMKMAQEIFNKGRAKGIDVVLPRDHVVKNGSATATVRKIQPGMSAADIGAETVGEWKKYFKGADTIVLAGPVGWYENPLFSEGSRQITNAIADETKSGTVTIAAGGDSSSMVRKFGRSNDFSLLSIGGGATLEFLMQGWLPVMDLLDRKTI